MEWHPHIFVFLGEVNYAAMLIQMRVSIFSGKDDYTENIYQKILLF